MMGQKLLWLVPGLALPLLAHARAGCSDITLTVNATSDAHDIVMPDLSLDDPNFADSLINTVVGDVGRIWLVPVGGTYDISATFCEPETYNDANAVQLLGHGATYNKLYWQGLGLPEDQAERYDWTRYATDRGYAVLAIDRLGAGNSSRPDPLLEVQASLSAEVIHQVVMMLRNGEVCDKKFSNVAYVGHSMGSLIGMRETQLYPDDFDALVLTGWSANFVENFPAILAGVLLPAAVELPKRFSGLNPFYLVLTIQQVVRQFFYGPDGTFDPAVEKYDWAHRDTVATGELVSILAGTTETGYNGPVHIIDGELDAAFCSPNQKCVPGPNHPPGNTEPLFPNATDFSYEIIKNTGHCLNTHLNANETFESAHEFLKKHLLGA